MELIRFMGDLLLLKDIPYLLTAATVAVADVLLVQSEAAGPGVGWG